MYQMIEDRVSVPDKYAESLVTRGVITHDELSKDTADYTDALNQELKYAENVFPNMSHLEGHWRGLVQASEDKITTWDTGVICPKCKFKCEAIDTKLIFFILLQKKSHFHRTGFAHSVGLTIFWNLKMAYWY